MTRSSSKHRPSRALVRPAGADHAPTMTILQLVPTLDEGGVERGALEIAEAIVRAGGRALIASAGGRLEPALQRIGGELVWLPDLASKNPFLLPGSIRDLTRVIGAAEVDIVHARSRMPAWAGYHAARRTNAPFVTTYHGTYSENFPGKRFYNSVMARGRPVIAVSEFIARLVSERHGIDPAMIVTIPRGADIAQFDAETVSAARTAAMAESWSVEDDPRPIVLLPARLTRWKGQGLLLDAAARMRGDGPLPFRIVLAGGTPSSPYGQELERQAEEAGLAGDIRLVGPVSDMPAALKLAAVVVCPSLEPEAFGRTVVEAQAMGRPVIAADHGGARETVDPGRSGWLVTPRDSDALARALDTALSLDESAREHMGMAGRARVRSQYSISAMQDRTIWVYRRILGQE